MNTIHDEWEDAKDSPCSGTLATAADERHAACLCHVRGRLQLDMQPLQQNHSKITKMSASVSLVTSLVQLK